MVLLLLLTATHTVRRMLENHALAHAFLEEMHFPEELIVNTSLEKAAAYIPKIKNSSFWKTMRFEKAAERNIAL